VAGLSRRESFEQGHPACVNRIGAVSLRWPCTTKAAQARMFDTYSIDELESNNKLAEIVQRYFDIPEVIAPISYFGANVSLEEISTAFNERGIKVAEVLVVAPTVLSVVSRFQEIPAKVFYLRLSVGYPGSPLTQRTRSRMTNSYWN